MHGEIPLLIRLGRVVLIVGAVIAAAGIAVSTGAIKLPRLHHSRQSADPSPAAVRMAADRQWASALCTNLLGWKDEITRDGTSLNLGLGPMARIKDAAAATTRMLNGLDKLGPPPAGQSLAAQRLRARISSLALHLKNDATSVASGNLLAIGALVTDLGRTKAMGTEIGNDLQRVVSADVGLSLAETGACRQLVGIPI
jgi:hypothetical protein